MTLLIDIIFVFAFVFVLIRFGLINIDISTNQTLLQQKIYMFGAVTVFLFLLNAMNVLTARCNVSMFEIIKTNLLLGLFVFVGHTIVYDMYKIDTTLHPKSISIDMALVGSIGMSVLVGRIIKCIDI